MSNVRTLIVECLSCHAKSSIEVEPSRSNKGNGSIILGLRRVSLLERVHADAPKK
ncbi:MAG TPA: hypothetical protein VE955_07240 [Candidatus Dormibacteraeota bacterium]|nr:hypothetical protein [Candidatus Dormibacteraeota bacterium]